MRLGALVEMLKEGEPRMFGLPTVKLSTWRRFGWLLKFRWKCCELGRPIRWTYGESELLKGILFVCAVHPAEKITLQTIARAAART